MSRSINESVNQLKTSLSDIKTSLSNKNIEGGQLKVSEVAGLIDQIEAGGGLDLEKAKYMTITPNESFYTYNVMEDSGYENEIHLSIDTKDYGSSGYFYVLTNAIDIKIADENSDYSNSWNERNSFNINRTAQKKIKFKGTNSRPIFLIVMATNQEILDILKVKVYCS